MEFATGYNGFFNVARRNVADKARSYLQGLLMKAPRKNMERMEEYVQEYDYQGQQQFLSDSPWSHQALMEQVARDANTLLGGPQSALLIDESAFEKKGEKSAGVARQWNGRQGKVDNAQVGVFAALSDGNGGALIDGRLYLPETWTSDGDRCREAKIPIAQQGYRSKPQLALEMIARAVETGVKFGWVGFDAFYGSTPWLLRKVEDMGLVFVGDVRSNATLYCADPAPYMPRRRNGRGRPFTQRRARGESTTMAKLFSEGDVVWEEVAIREGTKGTIRGTASAKRVWLWDGEEKEARQWWAVCVVDEENCETTFFLSNAPSETSLQELVSKHAVRYWIERAFQDAKTSLGMADYQARGWPAWHHHMAMVMLAMLFLLRERRVHLVEVELLSCQDIVELLNVFIPRRDLTPEDVIKNIERRHRKRREAMETARRASQARYVERKKSEKSAECVLTM